MRGEERDWQNIPLEPAGTALIFRLVVDDHADFIEQWKDTPSRIMLCVMDDNGDVRDLTREEVLGAALSDTEEVNG